MSWTWVELYIVRLVGSWADSIIYTYTYIHTHIIFLIHFSSFFSIYLRWQLLIFLIPFSSFFVVSRTNENESWLIFAPPHCLFCNTWFLCSWVLFSLPFLCFFSSFLVSKPIELHLLYFLENGYYQIEIRRKLLAYEFTVMKRY